MKEDQQEDIKKDLAIEGSLEAVAMSEGGQILIKALVKDIISSVDTLSANYSVFTIEKFISLCADIKSKSDMARTLTRSSDNKAYLEELLTEAIKE